MRSERAALDILFPKVRAEILRLLFGPARKRRHIRELMRNSSVALSTVQDELRKLSALGLLATYSDGYHRFYSPNGGHPLSLALHRIVEISERLPRTQRSALLRKRGSGPQKRRRPKPRPLRPDRGV